MKIAVVCFSEELPSTNSLLSQVGASPELWVLSGMENALQTKDLNAKKIIEINPSEPKHVEEPSCCAQAVYQCFRRHGAEILVFPSGLRGNDLAARVAVLIGGACMLEVCELCCGEGGVTVKKPVYSGNLNAEFRFETLPLVLSLKLSTNEKKAASFENPELVRFEAETEAPSWLTDIEVEKAEDSGALKAAELVIAGGRGVGRAENFSMLEELAEKMGGVLGGTRPAVYDGRIPRERMIGSSAAVLSPKCCIVFGASGAAPFLAGVEKSKLLIAVNRDPNALIFDNCDVGIVADCNEFALALSEQYGKN